MTALCQNGWPVIPGTDAATEVVRVGGRAFRVRRGDVARVFESFLHRYVAEIEPLDQGQLDDWSWAQRLVRGSTTSVSNHAGGTAIDVNALKHQRGVYHTFSAEQIGQLRLILADFWVLRWGGDYRSTVDNMHFEINATPGEVRRFVAEMEDDMPLSDDDCRRIARYVWEFEIDGFNQRVAAFRRLEGVDNLVNQTAGQVNRLHSGAYLAAIGRAVWDDVKESVAHLDPDRDKIAITMRTALARAAAVVPNLLRDTLVTVRHPEPGHDGETQAVDVGTALTRAAEATELRQVGVIARADPAPPPIPHRTTTPLEAP